MGFLNATSKLIRTGILLVLVLFLAFGALALPVAASPNDHHALSSIGTDLSADDYAEISCPSKHLSMTHDSDDNSCCVGMCTIILHVAAPVVAPTLLRESSGSSFRPMAARPSFTEFYRPPSLTI